MSLAQFYWSTPRVITVRIVGWHEYEDVKFTRWLKWHRWQTYILSLPLDHKKLHSPLSLFSLPDENELYTGGPGMTEEQVKAKEKRFEEEAHVFEKWDREMAERYANTIGT